MFVVASDFFCFLFFFYFSCNLLFRCNHSRYSPHFRRQSESSFNVFKTRKKIGITTTITNDDVYLKNRVITGPVGHSEWTKISLLFCYFNCRYWYYSYVVILLLLLNIYCSFFVVANLDICSFLPLCTRNHHLPTTAACMPQHRLATTAKTTCKNNMHRRCIITNVCNSLSTLLWPNLYFGIFFL